MDDSKILDRYILNKLFLIFVKYAPPIMALCCVFNTTLSYFGYDCMFLSFIGGVSLIPWLFMLIASRMFRFCIYHRALLYFIMIDNIINFVDMCIGIPADDYENIMIHYVILGVILLAATYKHIKKVHNERKRKAHKNTRDGGVDKSA